ncbi:hypothetical protein D3C72_588550 [compost metagenome]
MPSGVQCAASCKPLSSSLPLNSRLPTLTSPNSMASGNFSSGRVIGPLSGSSEPGGNVRLTWSACNCSMHKVMRVRHNGDQAKIIWFSSIRLVSCCHNTRSALHCPPNRPWKLSRVNPGTKPNAQRLPVAVPSTVASVRTTSINSAAIASSVTFKPRFTAQAPWKSAVECRHRRPARGPGRGGSAPPAIPSARRYRPRS